MCEVRSREKRAGTQKKKYNGQQQKEMDCHEPHPGFMTKKSTERPTGALVAVNSLWPLDTSNTSILGPGMRSSTCHVHWQDPLCRYLAGFVVGCDGTYFVIGCNGHYVEHICTFVNAINAVLIREIDTIDPSILHGVCEWDTTLCFMALHFHACLL